MKHSTKLKLRMYSRFALSCLFSNQVNVNGQVVYTDLDPDESVLVGPEYYLDMDQNGEWDFSLNNSSGTTYIYSSLFTSIYFIELMSIIPRWSNALATGQPESWISFRHYPIAFTQGVAIDELLNFETYPFQRMAWRQYDFDWNGMSTDTVYCCAGGYWFPEQLDKYLAVRFEDAEGLRHYGWIRCDVKDDGRTMIIKDYAYEATPEKGIIAGDTLGLYVDITTDKLSEYRCVYAEKKLFIALPQTQEIVHLQIFNINGILVDEFTLTDRHTQLSIAHLSPGYYLASLNGRQNLLTQAFIVH